MAFCKKQIFQRRWTWLLGCVLFCCMPGCGAGPVWQREEPEVVLTGFLETAEVQDTETMWEFLNAQTRDALLRHFKSVKRIREATLEELTALIGASKAQKVKESLASTEK